MRKGIISPARIAFAFIVMLSSARGREAYHVKTNHPGLLIEHVSLARV